MTGPGAESWRNRFGTFLYNSDQERRTTRNPPTVSFWTYYETQRKVATNLAYDKTQKPLRPRCGMKYLNFWSDCFLRYDVADSYISLSADEAEDGAVEEIIPVSNAPAADSAAGAEQRAASDAAYREPDERVVMWTPDSAATACRECQMSFTRLRRRHHCRACGQIFCGQCCHMKVALPAMGYNAPQRCCTKCAKRLLSESRTGEGNA